jgi:hypothetical protein
MELVISQLKDRDKLAVCVVDLISLGNGWKFVLKLLSNKYNSWILRIVSEHHSVVSVEPLLV